MGEELLEATPTDLLELTPLDSTGGLAVVVDGDVQLLPQARAEIVSQVDTHAHREIRKGNEGDHVGRAHPRMLATMVAQVDPLRRNGGARHRRIDRQRRLGDEGDDHAVVGGIGLDVDHPRARRFDGVGNGGDDVEPPAFREIRDALYKGCQTAPPTTVCRTRFTPT